MKWMNLKINKCPNCDKDFTKGLQVEPAYGAFGSQFLKHTCGFIIREVRYRLIVANQVTTDLEEQLEKEQEGGEI